MSRPFRAIVVSLLCGTASAFAADSATQPQRTFTLRVLDATTGEPIAGADLKYDRDDQPLVRSKSDADGKAVFECPPVNTYLYLSATDPTHVSMSMRWKLKADDGHDSYDVRLPRGTTIGGRVIDDAGQPVGGAKIELDNVDSNRSKEWPHLRIDLDSDGLETAPDGRWTYPHARADLKNLELTAFKNGYLAEPNNSGYYQTKQVDDLSELRSQTSTITLIRGVPINGRVIDADGRPVVAANVAIGEDRVPSNCLPPVVSDAAGCFKVGAIAGEPLTLTAIAKGHAPEMVTFDVPAAGKELTITLPKATPLTGRVTDTAGKPLADTTVYFDTWRKRRTLARRVRTDADGRFVWADAPSDAIETDIFKTGYADRRKLPLTAGQENLVTLTPPLRVTGTVVDDATGKPVNNFRTVIGYSFGKDRPVSWQPDRYGNERVTRKDNTFIETFTYPYPGLAVQIQAEGYLPAESPIYSITDGDKAFTFRLKPGKSVSATVTDAAGKPVSGAEVALVAAGSYLRIENGELPRYRMDGSKQTTDAAGKFSFPPQVGVYRLVALSPSGMADIADDKLPADGTIRLIPWAVVEGDAFIGSRPAAGVAIDGYLQESMSDGNRSSRPNVSYAPTTTTNAAGHFRFDRVPAGKMTFGRRQQLSSNSYTSVSTVSVTTEPGNAKTIRIGGIGRPVVGKLIMPEEVAGQPWGWTNGRLITKQTPLRPTLPDGFAAMSVEQKQAWYADWIKTDAGKAYAATIDRMEASRRFYNLALARDGTFRAEDIEPGTYTLSFEVDKPYDGQGGRVEPIARASAQVTVPPIEGGTQSDTPVDVPPITATAVRRLSVGQTAPAISVPTLDGKTVSLADFRGKFVLLDFWATWCGPCIAELPHIKAAYAKFGQDPRFVLLSLSLDERTDEPKAFIEKQDIRWPQGFLGSFDNSNRVTTAYGVDGIPSLWLIGPDGKVVAKDLRGDRIEPAITAALAATPTTMPTTAP